MTGSPHHASAARTDLFDRARAKVSVEDLLTGWNVKLVRQGKDMRGPCALCDGDGTRFAVKPDGKWRCYGCELHGDVVDLAQRLRKLDSGAEAARWLLGEDIAASAPRPAPKPREAGQPSTSDKVAAETWAGAVPLIGTLAERYLARRGIAADVIELAAANLRYHSAAKHHWSPTRRQWITAPAMVAQVVVAGPAGEAQPTGGIHVTYLDRATAGKAELVDADGVVMPAKRMWGQHRSADGRPGGAWLIGPLGIGALAVAEGIETTLSVVALAARQGRPMRACAALSLNRLQGGWVRDRDGCVDLADVQADPASPAFVWPLPAVGGWNQVVIAVDRDMSLLKVTGRTGRGKPCPMLLDAEARARICGRLAVAAWKSTGARQVRAIAPPARSDFNNELRRVLAAQSESERAGGARGGA